MSNMNKLLEEFNNLSSKVKRISDSESKGVINKGWTKSKKKKQKNGLYEKYRYRIDNGEFDKLTTRDFLYFFRDTANEVGVKYVIPNFKRDMKMFKTLKERGYTNEEILIMVEFLFKSEQDYLDKKTIQPTVLVSGWCNKIYHDSQAWLNDEYVPNSKSKFKDREFTGNTDETKVEIGEWDI